MNDTRNKKLFVGGQAVIEGVMMRSPRSMTVAVRRPSGRISIKEGMWRSLWERLGFLKWPFFRGTVVLIESMVNGMQALNFSAKEAVAEQTDSDGAKDGEISNWSMAVSMIVGLVFAVGLFKFVPHLAATYAGKIFSARLLTVDDATYHVIDGAVKLGIFVGYVAIIGLSKDIARVFQYHGAEHMAIYTYEAGEPLTVEYARTKSTLHPRCGTAFLMVVILVFILVAALSMPLLPDWAKPTGEGQWSRHIIIVLFKLPLLIPVAGLAYEFNRFAGRHVSSLFLRPLLWPGLGMQLLTTKRPTDDQLEISLASLRAALWREKMGNEAPSQDEPVVFESFSEVESAYPLAEHEETALRHPKVDDHVGQACPN